MQNKEKPILHGVNMFTTYECKDDIIWPEDVEYPCSYACSCTSTPKQDYEILSLWRISVW